MLATKNAYDQKMLQTLGLEALRTEEITEQLEAYLTQYHSCFGNSSQVKYFEAFEKGLLSDLDRKMVLSVSLYTFSTQAFKRRDSAHPGNAVS